MKNQVSRLALLFSVVAIVAVSCDSPRKEKSNEDEKTSSVIQVSHSQSPTHYKFYLENSGSVRGFFKGTSDAKVVLTQLTDRLEENFIEGDTISYNYVSNKIIPYNKERDSFLKDAYNNCTAAYSELDKNLNMVLDNVDENSVGFLISDYCFESKNGNWLTAQSGITRLFTQRLNQNPDLTVAIVKYNVGFDGRYFPGNIKCKKLLPLYIWAFGTSENIKRVVNLKVKNDGVFVLQSYRYLKSDVAKISGNKAAGRVYDNEAILVKHWKQERNRDFYSLQFNCNVDCLALSDELLKNSSNYNITNGYDIEEIVNKNGVYSMKIYTQRPAPGSIEIEYPYQLPLWVEESNFEGTGLPDDGTTLGFKYLVKGVFDAYNNKYENYFSTSITLK